MYYIYDSTIIQCILPQLRAVGTWPALNSFVTPHMREHLPKNMTISTELFTHPLLFIHLQISTKYLVINVQIMK